MKHLNLFEHFEPKKIVGREEAAKALKIFPKPPQHISVFISVKQMDEDAKWEDMGLCTYEWTDTDANGEENTFSIKTANEEIGSFQINLDGAFSEPWDGSLNYIPDVEIIEDDFFKYKLKNWKDLDKMAEYSALHILDNILNGILGVISNEDFPQEQVKKYRDFMYDSIQPFKLQILKALTAYID